MKGFKFSSMAWLVPVAAAGLYCTGAAHAATLVTGGDPGNGITLDPSNVVTAMNVNGDATFQGVSFLGTDPNITIDPNQGTWGLYTNAFNGAPTTFGNGDTQDQVLNAIAGDLDFGTGSSTTGPDGFRSYGVNITGLTPGNNYRLDVIETDGNATGRTQTVFVNGALEDTVGLTQGSATNPSLVYDSQVNGVADSSGDIALGFDQVTSQGPVFSAIVVSNAVPEPGSLALLGMGAACLLPVMRRHRRAC